MPIESVVQQPNPQVQAPNPNGGAPPSLETGAVPAKDDRISPKLEALIRRERIAIQREQAAKTKELEVQNRFKEFSEREKKIQEFESIKQSNPRKALELLGMSYQDLTQVELNDGQIPSDLKIRQVEDKFDQFVRSQQEAVEKQTQAQKELEEKRQAETLEQFKGQIGAHLKGNANRYELIAFEQSDDLVYDMIDEHYNTTLKAAQEKARAEGRDPSEEVGDVMKIAEAADKIEQLLEQKYDKARSLTKLQALMAPKPGQKSILDEQIKPKPVGQEAFNPSQKPQTLTHTLQAQSAPRSTGIVSDDERLRRAIAYARSLRP